jgi:hypothetical protein
MSRTTSPHLGNNFQIEVIIGMMEDDILLDNRTGWIPKGTGEIMKTWLKSGLISYRVFA